MFIEPRSPQFLKRWRSTLPSNSMFEWTVTSLLPLSKFHRLEVLTSLVLDLSRFKRERFRITMSKRGDRGTKVDTKAHSLPLEMRWIYPKG